MLSVAVSALLFLFLSYADTHKYEDGFDWVSSGTMQPLALVMVAAFVLGMALTVVGLLQKPLE